MVFSLVMHLNKTTGIFLTLQLDQLAINFVGALVTSTK